MSWTYSGDPAASTRDMVRFLIGDTDTTDQQLQDEEIDALLAAHSDSAIVAAIQAAESLAARYSRRADKRIGDLSISYNQIASSYWKLVANLRNRATLDTARPFAGGISQSVKSDVESDTDRTVPAFKVGLHDDKSIDPLDPTR